MGECSGSLWGANTHRRRTTRFACCRRRFAPCPERLHLLILRSGLDDTDRVAAPGDKWARLGCAGGGAYLCELDDGRAGGEEVYQTLWCGHPKHAPQPTQGREHARVTFRKGGISCIMCVVRHGPGYRLSACRSSSVFSEEVAWGLVNAELPRTLCPRRFPQRGWPPNFECNSRPGSCSLVLP